ncbi:MAG: ACP S-malonyltransferase [Gammaproteobacteria bacterium]|nr:ACP S-malonyltransferase [Gammaproteobacteria bacterium]MDD9896368.1 ACP S-malonyltransferase [Gammaproteobacteria bacterium]MDD9958153.1 ACP S-malonyltransferase [Gammaproteobacteria bacterium]
MQKFGFVFPGQGSQKLGMLSELAARSPVIQATFQEASEVLEQDLWEICQQDKGNILDQTHITQPALLTASVAVWRLWDELTPLKPSILAGHSLGEYSALVCANAISFQDAISIVHHRGQYMQAAVPTGEGKMAAIVGLENYQIDEICDDAEEHGVVSAANFNSPGQTVIAGEAGAVDKAIDLCKEAGAKRALPLNVSVPSHCALMKPAADQLREKLDEITINAPSVAVIQNVNAQICEDPDKIKQNLVKQLYAPVLWVDCVQLIYKEAVSKVVECGPGKVLSGLIRRIEPEIKCFGSDDAASIDSAIAEMSA